MSAATLADALRRHVPRDAREAADLAEILAFVARHRNPFDRAISEGHLTGSALVLSDAGDRVLLLFHLKLGRWLQPGGHADGDPDPLRVALREAREESGLAELAALSEEPLDVDVHPIPASGDDPAHLHYDIRYLLVAAPGQELRPSEESTALQWFERRRLTTVLMEKSLLRMERKTRAVLGRSS